MSSNPRFYLSGPDAAIALECAIGDYFDVKVEEERVATDCEIVDPVLRIYAKGETVPRLSLWLS